MSITYAKSSFVLRITLGFVVVVSLSGRSLTPTAAAGAILYVAPGGLTSGACASWATPCTLQYALGTATPGSALWIKKGTYYPTNSTDRMVSFVLKNEVAIHGGFAGTETDPTQRNPAANLTILSGDIGLPNNNGDNSYHVVIAAAGTNGTAILDGFTIRAGNAHDDSYQNSLGGGMYNVSSSPTLTDVTFRDNVANYGGGMFNSGSSPVLTNVTFSDNSANERSWRDPGRGGGMYNENGSSPALTNVTFSDNSATEGGGMYNASSSPSSTDVTFRDNSAAAGGGMFNNGSSPVLTNVTFSGNVGTYSGGGMYNTGSSPVLTNLTFSDNSAAAGGGMFNNGSSPVLANVTFSGNSAADGGGMYNIGSGPIIRNSILYGDDGGEIVSNQGDPSISYSIIQGGYPGVNNLDTDPLLRPLANNGGFTQTMALQTGSPAIDAAEDAHCPARDQRGMARPQGAHCDMGAYEAGPIKVMVGPAEVGSHALEPGESTRWSYANVNGGPARIVNTSSMPLIAAERVLYKVKKIPTSFSEMMGLPDTQLDTSYWLPWYNNKDLNSQLRFGNVSGTGATVHVFIGGVEVTGSPYTLAPGESIRRFYAGIDNGPVKIESDVPIVVAERVIYKVNGVDTSFSEMMALPASQLDTTYWLPWYNNKDLNTQLRFGNVSGRDATVHVFIGGVEVTGSPYTLTPGESIRRFYAGIDNGPVKIESDVPIVAAERVIYKVNGVDTSFSEMMALPASQLDTTYSLPWYNNKDLNTQLRFGNVSGTDATVHVLMGGVEVTGSPYTLAPGESIRRFYTGIDKGPVKIESDVPIVAAERVLYKVKGVDTSFSEMMALPASELDTTYWLPWYNNVELDTQLRFGVP